MILIFRPPRLPGPLVLISCLLVAPQSARAESAIIASRLAPSSLSARYGAAVPVHPYSPGGSYLVPTRTGVEFRGLDGTSDFLFGTFRTAGVIREVAWGGQAAYLFAGDRGIVAVDVGDSTNLGAIASRDHLGSIERGAFAQASGTLAAATDQALYFLRETAPGSLDLIDTRTYADGRSIVRVLARSDSFLVTSVRTSPTLRMMLTMYRVRAGAMPESLWDFQVNGLLPQDVAWPDAMAFIAIGNAGIIPFDTETRSLGAAVPVLSGQFVRDLDADAASVVAVGEARTYSQFTRSGPKGGTLIAESSRLTTLEPFFVTLQGALAILSEEDQVTTTEPDEISQSLLEVFDVSLPAAPGRTITTGLGRVRRVEWDQGLAYVADYSGGMRIYRAGSADTSLVGVVPLTGTDRAFDLSLDRARHLAYLAAGSGGLVIVDVTDPAAPVVQSTLALPGKTSAVTVIGDTLVAVGRRESSQGITFVDVTNPASPLARGAVDWPSVIDPRALAARDTVLFVADAFVGVLSIGFGNPDAPAVLGFPSGIPANDIDLAAGLLLVGGSFGDVQIVDATDPAFLVSLGTIATPPTYGVAQQGATAIALLGDGGALAIDLRVPSVPLVRGVIQVPGFSRDAVWVGDTLLIAQSFGLERFRATPVVTSDPRLTLSIDPASVQPRVTISWTVSLPVGAIGWDLYRDLGSASSGLANALGVRVNDALLWPATTSAADVGVQAATTYRYRLEAFFPDGSSRKVAEGSIYTGSNAGLGRPYPNPYRPRNGAALSIPYRVLSIDAGKSIEVGVYDPSGRLVRRVRTSAVSGFGSVTWDGRDDRGRLLADGVYFVKMNGPGIDDARQLILLR